MSAPLPKAADGDTLILVTVDHALHACIVSRNSCVLSATPGGESKDGGNGDGDADAAPWLRPLRWYRDVDAFTDAAGSRAPHPGAAGCPAQHPFGGLQNNGNTCYVNAALQLLRHVPEPHAL